MTAPLSSAWLRAQREAHVPDEALRLRAESAGTNLARLKQEDPTTYMIVCAAPLVRTDARLLEAVWRAVQRVLPEHQLFQLPLVTPQTDTELRVFPPLTREAQRALDDAFGALSARPELLAQGVFFRVVEERSGARRELAWPLPPSRYASGVLGLVGPFGDEAAARAWGEAHTDPRSGVVFDTLPHAGGWFCDLFRGE